MNFARLIESLNFLRRLILVFSLVILTCTVVIPVFSETIVYKYDLLHRLIEVHYPDKIIYYTYDAAGNRTSMRVELAAVPMISGLSPTNTNAGGSAFILTVNGASFTGASTVTFNGNNRSTTFVSTTQLTAQINAADIAVAGTYPITVVNPPGAVSQAVNFTVSASPVLQIDAVTPAAGRASGGQQVKLTGSFVGLSSISVGGVSASWSYTNGTSEITLTTPQHAVGAVGIDLVPTSGSTYSKTNAFAFLPTTFTDDTLVAGVTTAKAQHIIELRQAIDALRAVSGLSPAPWTDGTLAARNNVIGVTHIQELRTYLDEAAVRLGYAAAPYTDPSLSRGSTVKRVHIEELRQRIRTVAG